MRISNAVAEYSFAGLLVIAVILLNIFGRSGDGTVQSITNMLGLFIAALIGRGTAVSATASTIDRAGDKIATKVTGAINGHIEEAITNAANVTNGDK